MTERQKETKKIFAVSDIHGCATALKKALDGAGFNPKDESHLLVVLGDLFDRGIENREVLAYLKGIKNKILIRGNHEDIIMESLTSGAVRELQFVNETYITLAEFFPNYHGERMLDIFEPRARKTAEMLIDHITGMRDFFETESYIFVHGWLPDDANESDFRYASVAKWHNARWLRWNKRYPHFPIPDGKTLVVGHTAAYYGSQFDRSRSDYDCSIFYGDHLVAIDGSCASTGRVNVLVIEDGVYIPTQRKITLTDTEIDDLARGKARAIVLPYEGDATEFSVGDKLRLFNTGGDKTLNFVINNLHLYPDIYSLADEFSGDELGRVCQNEGTLCDHLSTVYSDTTGYPLLVLELT